VWVSVELEDKGLMIWKSVENMKKFDLFRENVQVKNKWIRK